MASRWLQQVTGIVDECWQWQALARHICLRCRKPEDQGECWEVWIYPAVQEILGGPHDGETGWGRGRVRHVPCLERGTR
jgi:hypothetical protein